MATLQPAADSFARARPPLAILIAATALGPLALNIFIPSMAGMAAVFETDYATVQLALSSYLLALALAQPVLGPLSDRFGRRPVLMAGLATYTAGAVACAFAPTVEALIAGRILQAVGGCAGLVIGRAILRDIYDRDRAASMIGYVTMAMVVAPMVSPALGGWLDARIGWHASFLLCAALGALVVLWATRSLHETLLEPQPMPGVGGLFRSWSTLLRQKAFLGYALTAAFASGMYFGFLAGAPYVVTVLLGRPPLEFGVWFALGGLAYMTGNFGAAQLSQRLGGDRMIAIGNMTGLIGVGILLALTLSGALTSTAAVFLPLFMVALANGLALPNALAAAISIDPRLAGTASGLAGMLQMGTGAIATFVVGWAQGDTAWGMVAVMTVSGCLAVAAFLFAQRAMRASSARA